MLTARLGCRAGIPLALVAMALASQTNFSNWNAVKALKPGADVRIAAGSRTVRGTVDRITHDPLVVTSGKSQEMFNRQRYRRFLPGSRGIA